MWSGTSSVGRATIERGKSGKSSTFVGSISFRSVGARPPGPVPAPAQRFQSRPGGSGAWPLGAEQQVVEQRRRQPRLEHVLVELLQRQIAVERVAPPENRNVVGLGARLERAIEPPEPVRDELLAADRDLF